MKKGLPRVKSRGFTLVELLVVITIIGILASIGLGTFTSSQMKSRDARRKTQLKQMADAYEAYYNDKGQYPADDSGGNFLACGDGAVEACVWGSSAMSNTTTGTVYMVKLPQDPTLGLSYYYDAGTPVAGLITNFQLYARLENTNDQAVAKNAQNNPLVFENLNCGTKLCNFGVSSSNTQPQSGRNQILEP
ncbi:prepilin-type N-terminal cleavage/methylation domain-containing protein [Patescibacteria group bacterium]|nr:prepilin-type N-terminal cleavage/methylation domain-containing protein [Patescibacteria group bacterium]